MYFFLFISSMRDSPQVQRLVSHGFIYIIHTYTPSNNMQEASASLFMPRNPLRTQLDRIADSGFERNWLVHTESFFHFAAILHGWGQAAMYVSVWEDKLWEGLQG